MNNMFDGLVEAVITAGTVLVGIVLLCSIVGWLGHFIL